MEPFTRHTGVILPIDRANVDTDALIPKQYLKAIGRTGFGANLFDDWRWLDPGDPMDGHRLRRPNPACILNQPAYQGASILLARDNFGCGSSREHAVWALADYDIRAVLAPGFADIFFQNTLSNGLLALALPAELIDRLFAEALADPGVRMSIDLDSRTLTTPGGEAVEFTIEPHRRHRLLHGLDDIALTLAHSEEIRAYERLRRQEAPWLFPAPPPESGDRDGNRC